MWSSRYCSFLIHSAAPVLILPASTCTLHSNMSSMHTHEQGVRSVSTWRGKLSAQVFRRDLQQHSKSMWWWARKERMPTISWCASFRIKWTPPSLCTCKLRVYLVHVESALWRSWTPICIVLCPLWICGELLRTTKTSIKNDILPNRTILSWHCICMNLP